MAEIVTLNKFRRIKNSRVVNDPQLSPSAEDRMVLIEETGAVPGQQVELGLEAEPNITWWKALEIYANGGLQIASIATQDNVKGPQCVRLPLVGELAAMEIVDGARVQILDAYRPERFF